MAELIKAVSSVTADQGMAAGAVVVVLALLLCTYLSGQRRERRMLDAIIGERHEDTAPSLRSIETKLDDVAGTARQAHAKAEEAVARVDAVDTRVKVLEERRLRAVEEG